MKKRTTIQIEKEIRKALKDCKRYKRETYNDAIKRLIKKERKFKK